MDFLFNPYGESKIKAYLKMAVQRIQIANNKRINAVKIQKQKISQLLAEGKDEKARIQVEHIIRDDFTIEGYEVLELMCELVHERIRQITTSTTNPPPDLKEAVCSLIWASKNVEIDELKNVRQQLQQKFGSEFVKIAEANANGEVNARLYNKLVYRPPSKFLVVKYLEEIARAYNVDWTPSAIISDEEELSKTAPFATPEGTSIPMAPASGFAGAYAPTLIPPCEKTKFPTLTAAEEEELEAAKRLRSAESYNRPVPDSAQSPATTSLNKNPHVGLPALPVNPRAASDRPTAEELSIEEQTDVQPPPSTAPPVPPPPPPLQSSALSEPPLDPLAALQARLAALNRDV